MNRKHFAILAAIALTLAALAASPTVQRAFGLSGGHKLFHVNCPAGSHGRPRFNGVGQQLDTARQEARTIRTLSSRAVTAR